tara:strand:+ start:125 stop:328 length:204 start_codon:yes stop_codon:yes gene_type:complete
MNRLLEALVARYNGQILEAKANIDVYRNSVGIGEHSDIVAELDKQVAILAEAEDKLESVLKLLKEYE